MPDATKIDDCWNRIGVWAKSGRNCPRLNEAVHCRNCDVYKNAGRLLMDRNIPPEQRQRWREKYAEPSAGVERQGTLVVLFRISGELFALSAKQIKTVGNRIAFCRIPHRNHPALLGIANMSGDLEVIVSLSVLLGIDGGKRVDVGLTERTGRKASRMLHISTDSGSFGVEVDEVIGLYRHDDKHIKSLPATLEKAQQRYVLYSLAIDGHHAGFLDAERLAQRVGQVMQ